MSLESPFLKSNPVQQLQERYHTRIMNVWSGLVGPESWLRTNRIAKLFGWVTGAVKSVLKENEVSNVEQQKNPELMKIHETIKAGQNAVQEKVQAVLAETPQREKTPDEERFTRVVNEARKKAGLPEFKINDGLCALARAKAEKSAEQGKIDHEDGFLENSDPAWGVLGECLGFGYPTPEAALRAFLSSDQDRKTHPSYFEGSFTDIGIGMTEREGKKYYAVFFSGGSRRKAGEKRVMTADLISEPEISEEPDEKSAKKKIEPKNPFGVTPQIPHPEQPKG